MREEGDGQDEYREHWNVLMKSLTTLALMLFLFLASVFYWYVASAATQYYLQEEKDLQNGLKLCIYTEGMTVTVKSHQLCPLTIHD